MCVVKPVRMAWLFALLLPILLFEAAEAAVGNIDPQTLLRMQQEGVPVIDIRTPREWRETGTIPGARRLMFFDEVGRADVRGWLERFRRIVPDKNQPFILVCRSGNRTSQVGRFLEKRIGMKQVYHLAEGMNRWLKEKRPVVFSREVE